MILPPLELRMPETAAQPATIKPRYNSTLRARKLSEIRIPTPVWRENNFFRESVHCLVKFVLKIIAGIYTKRDSERLV